MEHTRSIIEMMLEQTDIEPHTINGDMPVNKYYRQCTINDKYTIIYDSKHAIKEIINPTNIKPI